MSNKNDCSCCNDIRHIHTRYHWLNKLFLQINSLSILWILIFINIVFLSVLNYFIDNNHFLNIFFDNKSIPMLVAATIAMLLMYPKFFAGFLLEIKKKTIGLMTFVSFSTTLAYVLSVCLISLNFIKHTNYTIHFDECIGILTFLSIGVLLSKRIRHQGDYTIMELLKSRKFITKKEINLIEKYKKTRVGDILTIKTNSKILVDGIITTGETKVSEIVLTPKSFPVTKSKGMSVYAGSINLGKMIKVKVTHLLDDSKLAMMINKSKSFSNYKPRVKRLADNFAKYLLMIEFLVAIFTFCYKYLIENIELFDSILFTLTVFFIFCPLAVGVLPPAVLTIASAILNKKSIYINNTNIFDNLKSVKYTIFSFAKTNDSHEFFSLIKQLKKKKIKTVLFYNCNEENVDLFKQQNVFDEYLIVENNEQKDLLIKSYKKKGKVLFIGDEIKDKASFRNANISVVISNHFSSSNIVSDITFYGNNIFNIHFTLNLIKKAQFYIVCGIIWFFLYNTIAFIIVVFTNIDPLIGAGIMLMNHFLIFFFIFTFRLLVASTNKWKNMKTNE